MKKLALALVFIASTTGLAAVAQHHGTETGYNRGVDDGVRELCEEVGGKPHLNQIQGFVWCEMPKEAK